MNKNSKIYIKHSLDQNLKEVNIILLGESGVGKTTFINSLANFLEFASLEEAEKSVFKYLIPVHFTIPNKSGKRTTINIGDDANEKMANGRAATCSAKDYTITIKNTNTKLTIIDTPGVADTDGFQKDQQNMKNTIECLSKYERINGICVLFKANEARLNVQFKYCFKELLIHLHKNACPNIVFCFTNTRGTFYEPGDSYPIVEELVKSVQTGSKIKIPFDENIFCFDNEAFRYLAALKTGVEFSKPQRDEYMKSWDKSSEMAQKMLEYITKLKFHDASETVTLNKIREIVTRLGKPIAEVSQNIQTNIKLAMDKKSELNSLDSNSNNIMDQLYATQVDFKSVNLEHRRTVCTHEACKKVLNIGLTEIIDYPTHCHPHCYLEGFETNTINCAQLKGCDCMNEKHVCKHCTHDWSEHMHITYENKQVEVKFKDDNVQNLIEKNEDKKILLRKSIEATESLIEKLKLEQNVIIEVSSQLAYFTRKNAILVFNNDLEAYLDLLIKEEEMKLKNEKKDQQILDGLKNVKNNYIENRKAFENLVREALEFDQSFSISDIDELIKKLYDLPINGPKIKNIIQLTS